MKNLEKETKSLETIHEKEESEESESGYSEAEQAKDREMRSGDLYALKKSYGFQKLHGSAKTLAAYQTISRQLIMLVESYTQLIEKDLHQAQKMLGEIARIRAMQKVLLTKLFGKLPEEIDDKEVLKELQDFI